MSNGNEEKFEAVLEDPPALKKGAAVKWADGLVLADKNPGQWVRAAEYKSRGSAQNSALSLRAKHPRVVTTCRGFVMYIKVEAS